MITLYFWACLVATGKCSQKSILRYADATACNGLGPQLAAMLWANDRPEYRLQVDRDHPIECKPKEERSA